MKAQIQHNQATPEFDTAEKCFITEWSNTPDDAAASIARARVAPGVTTQKHRLKFTAERYVILQGRGFVEIGELPPQTVQPGDVVRIPPECWQCISNTGTSDLVFLAICTPRFEVKNYESV